MGSSRRETELEEQLKEAGNVLLNPPASMDEIITLLDKIWHLLANVEQAPSKSTVDALLPTMKGLIANDLLRHSDINVRLSVASCISEITRITAPESPYNDDLMKEIFQLTVSAFEFLSHASGCCYMKALSILDTVAKVRSCLLMLDLECDKLVIEMFQHFLKVIRPDHPHVVFSAMETIMTLVIDESEDVSWELLSVLLASVRKENQNVSPISWKLGEKVFTRCASKLKTNLKEAVESKGIALNDYAEVVACICRSGDENPQHGHLVNQLAIKEPDPLCLGEVLHDVDGNFKSMTSNRTAPSGNEDSVVKDQLSNVVAWGSQVEHSQGVDAECSAGAETLDSHRNAKSDLGTDSAPSKRGKKPNSLMNPEEGYDRSWISGRKTAKVPRRGKTHDKGIDCVPSENHDSKKKALNLTDNNLGDRKSGLPKVSHRRKGWTKKQRSTANQAADPNSLSVNPITQVQGSPDFSLRKESEDRSDTKRKRCKRTKTTQEINQTPGHGVSEKATDVPSVKKEKPWPLSGVKKGRRISNDDESSVQKDVNERSLVVGILAQSISEASGAKKKKISKATAKLANIDGKYSEDTLKTEVKKKHASGKEKKIMNAAAKSSNRDGNHSEKTPATEVKKKPTATKEEKKKKISKGGAISSDGNCSVETPKTRVKRKHTTGKASESPVLDEQLVGCRIKVWWPIDKTFYDGSVESYNHIKKKHRILYSDGDEELLNLNKQRWELIKDGPSVMSTAEQETDVLKPDASSDVLKPDASSDVLKPDISSDILLPKEKDEIRLDQVKEVKASSLERGTPSGSTSKPKSRKYGGDSSNDATHERIKANESKADVSEKGSVPNSPAKLVLKDRKLIFTLSKPLQAGNTSKDGSLDANEAESAIDSLVEASKDAMKESTSNIVNDTNMGEEK